MPRLYLSFRIHVRIGTGTNCCYVEDLEKVELWDGDMDEPRKVSQWHPWHCGRGRVNGLFMLKNICLKISSNKKPSCR